MPRARLATARRRGPLEATGHRRPVVPSPRHTEFRKMAAITASMVGELRAKTDAPDDGVQEGPDRGRGRHGARRGTAARQARQQGQQGRVAHHRRRRGRRVVDGNTGALVEVNCETDFVVEERHLPGLGERLRPARRREATRPTWPRCRALPYSQDGFGPTLEDVRKGLIGKIGENMSIRRFKRYEGGASWRATCTARASA